jgi:hypothetical protein
MMAIRRQLLALLACLLVTDGALSAEHWTDLVANPYRSPLITGAFCVDEERCDGLEPMNPADTRDRDGLRRDTWYFLGYQAATIGILYMAPESVSGWTDEQKDGYSMSIWWDNVTHPAWDSDDFYINYVLHPYWGAAYYVRAQERGYSGREAFWYSFMLSTAYEFGAEALFEEPSIQDLVVTPVFGSLLGRYFMGVRSNIRERDAALGSRRTRDKWLWVLTDPLGSLNRRVDKWFGREASFHMQPYLSASRRYRQSPFAGPYTGEKNRVAGVQFYLAW